MRIWIAIILVFYSFLSYASSQSPKQTLVYETFWQPMFHGERLSYCDPSETICGQAIAQQYCCLLGYAGVNRFAKAENLGLTRYLSGRHECQGWQCAGFAWIKCFGHRRYHSRPLSDYQHKLFARPHWMKFPLAWCAGKTKKTCGKQAAYEFCRWQGYADVLRFSKPKPVIASRNIHNNELCIEQACKSFEYIICKRP
jgi:hypothetical protein